MKEELFQNLHLQLSTEDIKRIDSWKIENGMKSRAEAIRSMIKSAFIISTNGTSKNINLQEKESKYFVPDSKSQKNSKPEGFEEIIRKIVKDELEKISKKNK